MDRKILHLDLDAFFCSVEERRDPDLKSLPFVVGGSAEGRGVVASSSYAARQYGIRSAMPTARALSLCPQLVVVSSDFSRYGDTSRQVMACLYDLTARVEQLSIDEAFLDVSDLPQPGQEIARDLQRRINTDLDLPCSLGVASNKLVAKIANNVGKASVGGTRPPNSIKTIPPGGEAAFLAPLPVQELWGVGPKTAARLQSLGMRTIGDLAAWPVSDLEARFGQIGRDLSRRAQGIDDRPVIGEHEAKSISQEVTFAADVNDRKKLLRTMRSLAEGVGYRLRGQGLAATTVKIKLRWADFTTLTRQVSFEQPTSRDDQIFEAAAALFDQTWKSGKWVRLLGVGVSGLKPPLAQMDLWPDGNQKRAAKLQTAVDQVRHRFGRRALMRASNLDLDDETRRESH